MAKDMPFQVVMKGHYTQVEYTVPKMNKAFTYFSLKKKFKTILNDFKTEF
jgi:hypothetical protein